MMNHMHAQLYAMTSFRQLDGLFWSLVQRRHLGNQCHNNSKHELDEVYLWMLQTTVKLDVTACKWADR